MIAYSEFGQEVVDECFSWGADLEADELEEADVIIVAFVGSAEGVCMLGRL
jgi:hypothetical protein